MTGRFDERERPSSVVGQWFGSGWSTPGPYATGGVASPAQGPSGYKYLQFNSTGSLTVVYGGTFEIYSFGGGGGGSGGNGYNAFGGGGFAGGNGTITKSLAAGTYTITVGNGGTGCTAPTGYTDNTAGSPSYFGSDNTVAGTYGAGGAKGVNLGLTNSNGAAGTDVSTFIGGSTLYKGAGGGNANTGLGGSGIGGNAASGTATAGSAAANTASGGGGSGGSGQPSLQCGIGGSGGSGIVYVRWRG